jgi:Protein of unknown function (DUF2577).
MSNLQEAIKTIVNKSMASQTSCDGEFGTIKTIDPITVELQNGIVVPSALIGVCQHITDYEIAFELNQNKEATELSEIREIENFFVEHEEEHDVQIRGEGALRDFEGKGTIKLLNHLEVDDKVFMLRFSNGQFFVIVDRVVNANA